MKHRAMKKQGEEIQPYAILASALDEDEWSSCPSCFIPERKPLVLPDTGCWRWELVWTLWRRMKFLPLLEIESRFSSRPARSVVTILSYSASYHITVSVNPAVMNQYLCKLACLYLHVCKCCSVRGPRHSDISLLTIWKGATPPDIPSFPYTEKMTHAPSGNNSQENVRVSISNDTGTFVPS
jgi:hypothetical protein